MTLKKIVKISLGTIVFITLPSLLLFGFIYFKYNEPLPDGTEGKEADNLATKMLIALNFEAYRSTDYIEWTFKNRRHYKWKKSEGICEVYWKDYIVKLNLTDHTKSKATVHGFTITSKLAEELLEKALTYFEKDSFWLIAPFSVFDYGTTRKIVLLDNNEKGLLVTYPSNDSYLWTFDSLGVPKSFKIWTSSMLIDGLEASWKDWTIADTGVKLPTHHELLMFGFEISDIKAD